MSLASSVKAIDSQLTVWVEKIEQQNPNLSVLAARQFRYKAYQIPVEVSVTEPRKFNVLEEFVLRASVELAPPPTQEELAIALGLDPVFIRSTAATLQTLQILKISPDSLLVITPEGRKFYEKGSVPQEPKQQIIYALDDPLQENLVFRFSPLESARPDLPDLEDGIEFDDTITDISTVPLVKIQQLVQASGLGLHVPEEGKAIAGASAADEAKTIWQTVSLFLLLDSLEDQVSFQVRRGKQILESASNLLESLQSRGKVSLSDLYQVSDEAIASRRQAILASQNQTLDETEEALKQLQRDNRWELFPAWLEAVTQGVKSKNILPDSACLGMALSLLSEISADNCNIDSLREGWQGLVGAIALENRATALTLLNDSAWSHFVRLGIAQPPIDSPEKFISNLMADRNQPLDKTSSKTKGKKKK